MKHTTFIIGISSFLLTISNLGFTSCNCEGDQGWEQCMQITPVGSPQFEYGWLYDGEFYYEVYSNINVDLYIAEVSSYSD